MCEVKSMEKTTKNKPKKKIQRRSPSNGQNDQLVHWWLLVHFGCRPQRFWDGKVHTLGTYSLTSQIDFS
jgi:hypothetical protein